MSLCWQRLYSTRYSFSSSHVWMRVGPDRRLNTEEWCFQVVVLEKTLESPLDCKEIKPVNPKGNQPWILIAETDAEAEVPIHWPPDAKSWFIGKDPDAGKDWGQEVKGMTEDEMVGWHHQLNGHEFEQTPGYSEGQRRLQWVWDDLVTKQQQQQDVSLGSAWVWLGLWSERD